MIKNKLYRLRLEEICDSKSWVIEGDSSDDNLMNKTRKILHDMGYTWCNGVKLCDVNEFRGRVWYIVFEPVYRNENQGAKENIRCLSNVSSGGITETNKKHMLNYVYNDLTSNTPIYKASYIIKKYENKRNI